MRRKITGAVDNSYNARSKVGLIASNSSALMRLFGSQKMREHKTRLLSRRKLLFKISISTTIALVLYPKRTYVAFLILTHGCSFDSDIDCLASATEMRNIITKAISSAASSKNDTDNEDGIDIIVMSRYGQTRIMARGDRVATSTNADATSSSITQEFN